MLHKQVTSVVLAILVAQQQPSSNRSGTVAIAGLRLRADDKKSSQGSQQKKIQKLSEEVQNEKKAIMEVLSGVFSPPGLQEFVAAETVYKMVGCYFGACQSASQQFYFYFTFLMVI